MEKKKYPTIMLIDDNEIDNLINQKMIEAAAISERVYTNTGAKSGLEFLRNIEKTGIADKILPDLIFLDIDMPLMDGFQFLDEFEKLSQMIKKTCQVIMLTSSTNPQDYNLSKKYPIIKMYLSKPLSLESIHEINV